MTMKNLLVETDRKMEFASAYGEAMDTRYEIEAYRSIISEWWTVVVKSPTLAVVEIANPFTLEYLHENLGMFSKADTHHVGLLIQEMTGIKYFDVDYVAL